MTDNTQPEAREFTMSQYASKDDMIGAMRKRIAELESELEAVGAGGVQALSAAPAVPTSVKGAMWFTKKPVTIQAIQWTGENLREVITFTDGPPDTRSHHAGMAWDDYRDLVARDGLKIYTLEGKMLASPGDWIIRGVKGELYPCKPDIFQETYAAASPTPPVEQQATTTEAALGVEPVSVYAKLPEALLTQYDDIDGEEFGCFAEGQMRDFADRTHALRMEQAAPKAAPGGQTTVPAEWLEQAYREGWAACRDAETIWEEAEDWAFGNSTANSRMIDAQQAAPQQEPSRDAKTWCSYVAGMIGCYLKKPDESAEVRAIAGIIERRLWALPAPQPAPAPLSEDVVKDAARYQWLREGNDAKHGAAWHVAVNLYGCEWDAAIDAAIAAQGDTP